MVRGSGGHLAFPGPFVNNPLIFAIIFLFFFLLALHFFIEIFRLLLLQDCLLLRYRVALIEPVPKHYVGDPEKQQANYTHEREQVEPRMMVYWDLAMEVLQLLSGKNDGATLQPVQAILDEQEGGRYDCDTAC